MDPRAYLRKRTLRKNFLLEGEPWHERFNTLARPVDALLAACMRMPQRQPPIFIMGPQRSGTTLFFKCLLQHHQVCAIDQAVDYFPDSFLTASLYFRAIGATTATDFLEPYDLKNDLWIRTWKNQGYAYTEGNRVWSRMGPDGRWRSDAHREWAKRFFPRMTDRLQRYTGNSIFLNKCPANALRIGQLTEVFPDARFIHVERDPRGVINSIMNIHRALNVRSWGPMPVPESELQGLTEYERITRQWIAITDAIATGLRALPEDRKRTIRYEEFMRDTNGHLAGITQGFGMEPFSGPVRMDVMPERAAGWKNEIPTDEIVRIERLIIDAGYGHTMNDA